MSTHTKHVRNGDEREEGTARENNTGHEHDGERTPTRTAPEHTRVVESEVDTVSGSYRLLVPVLGESTVEETERLVRTATIIARDREGEVLVVSFATLPEQTPLGQLTIEDPPVREAHDTVERVLRATAATGVPAKGIVCLTHREAQSVLDMTAKYECDGVLLAVNPDRSQRRRLLTGSAIEKVLARANADVFVEKPGPMSPLIDRILLAASGGPHSGLAAETARALARVGSARVDVLHVLGAEPTDDERRGAERVLDAATYVLDDVARVETEVVHAENVAEAIIERSGAYDVTVLGAPTRGLLLQFVLGTVPDSVKRRSENAVLMTKQETGRTSTYYRWIAGVARAGEG